MVLHSIKKALKKRRIKRNNKEIFSHIIKDIGLLFVALIFFGIGILLVWVAMLKIPDFSTINTTWNIGSTQFYDRTGKILLYDTHTAINKTTVPFSEISDNIKHASVAIEDKDFYSHIGIQPTSILRAVFANLGAGSFSQGGSTITQQVVKNTLLTKDKTISRKLKEWVLSLKLERVYTKDEILSMYLNGAPYGGNIYGVEQASMMFFEKHAKDVTLAEAAYLAALPQRPTTLSPYGNRTDLLEERKNLVLKQMLDQGYIKESEYKKAITETVEFGKQSSRGFLAPHFVTWVMEQISQEYGERAVQENGYKVITTLDYNLQKKAEDIVAQYGAENEKKFKAKNASMVGIDPKTGEILVMVGSRNYFDVKNDGNFNVAVAQNRQPGSSFKPFVYATAFMKGYTPDTVLFNIRTQFSTTCDAYGNPLSGYVKSSCFMPVNYDGKYTGPMTLRDALAQSVNVPAVKLLYLAGTTDSIETAKKMGVTSLTNQDPHDLTLVLGSGSVSLLEMTSAYGVFANEGVRFPYQGIINVEDKDENILKTYSGTPEQVLPKNTALQISDILSDNVARAPAFGENSALSFGDRDVAVKTGTTNDYRDAWIIGYTPSFALGAWVGNNDNHPMEKKVAGFIVAPMWNTMMKEVLTLSTPEVFPKPEPTTTFDSKPVLRGIWQGNDHYLIDTASGKLATAQTPKKFIQEKVAQDVHSILYWIDRSNPLGIKPQNPLNDPQFNLWETPIRKWAVENGYGATESLTPPSGYDDVHIDSRSPKISFTQQPNLVLPRSSLFTITINHSETYPIDHVDYFVNNTLIGTAESEPFSITFTPSDISSLKDSNNELKAIAYDTVLNTGSITTTFNIQ